MRIEKAQESLHAAELCYESGLYNSAVSRAYYAMFQAAVVALEMAGILPDAGEWTHRRKIYPSRMTAMLSKGLNFRNAADYGDADLSEHLAIKVLRWAREFVVQSY